MTTPAPLRVGQRALPAAYLARTRARDMGPRQRHILAWLRLREERGEPSPTAAQVHAAIDYPHGVGDVLASLLGLELRGYVRGDHASAPRARWMLTQEGWAAE